ncbi:low molecular weight protein-tyrosine-phosphatase [Nocardioides sp.]|uniref:low molecular weight protein-tyrosine-phosphatase n=1 Tax=Nocardioides sp. TaxID=35761 RepID=UPI0035276454
MTGPGGTAAGDRQPTLPPPRTAGRYRVTIVCTGNICRSPTADVVLGSMLAEAGLEHAVAVDSYGLGGWHVGDGMDRRSASTLAAAGYHPHDHRARQLPRSWVDGYDLVLAMDDGHLRDLRAQARAAGDPAEHVLLFGDFDPVHPGGNVEDPYYGGPDGFEEVLAVVERTSEAIVAALRRSVSAEEPDPR